MTTPRCAHYTRLDREGLSPGAVLTAAHLHIRDRGEDGSVHLNA
jgi:hypothetical protein